MSRTFVFVSVAVLLGSGCAGAAEPIDCIVMAGLLGLRTIAERVVNSR
jgi:hypothetical protein